MSVYVHLVFLVVVMLVVTLVHKGDQNSHILKLNIVLKFTYQTVLDCPKLYSNSKLRNVSFS